MFTHTHTHMYVYIYICYIYNYMCMFTHTPAGRRDCHPCGVTGTSQPPPDNFCFFINFFFSKATEPPPFTHSQNLT